MSEAVEKISDFLVGIVVFLSMSLVITSPIVSIPKDKGVTSNNSTSLTPPFRTPPCTAAPIATTSSGFTPWFGFFPSIFSAVSTTFGILVIPPTRTNSLIFSLFNPESLMHSSTGFMVFSKSLSHICSSLALVRSFFMCFGPVSSAVIKGIFNS